MSRTGWYSIISEGIPHHGVNEFQVRGIFSTKRIIIGEKIQFSDVSETWHEFHDTRMEILSSWRLQNMKQKPLYPLVEVVAMRQTPFARNVIRKDGGVLFFFVTSSLKQPANIHDLFFSGPYLKSDLPLVEKAVAWMLLKSHDHIENNFKDILAKNNPVMTIMALLMLRKSKNNADPESIDSIPNLPDKLARDVARHLILGSSG